MKQNYKNEHLGIKDPGPVWNIKVDIGHYRVDSNSREKGDTKKWKIKVILN